MACHSSSRLSVRTQFPNWQYKWATLSEAAWYSGKPGSRHIGPFIGRSSFLTCRFPESIKLQIHFPFLSSPSLSYKLLQALFAWLLSASWGPIISKQPWQTALLPSYQSHCYWTHSHSCLHFLDLIMVPKLWERVYQSTPLWLYSPFL